MSIINPIKTIKVDGFDEFCKVFKIKTKLVAGDDGSDDELIAYFLSKKNRNGEKWFITFIDDRNLGYFLLHQFT